MKLAGGYEYSSWGNDYLDMATQRVCHTESVVNRYGMKELSGWVDMPLPEKVGPRQMSRISGMPYTALHKIWEKM